MKHIAQGVGEKKGVISAHDPDVLYGGAPGKNGHAVVVTGVKYDANGNPETVYINDTNQGETNGKANAECCKQIPAATYDRSLRPQSKVNVTNDPVW